jgi:hypothetical protein
MKISELKSYIKEEIKKKLAENAPAKPKVAPAKPQTDNPKRRPLGNPNVDPRPKAMTEGEKEILQKIVDRFKVKK